MRLAFTDRLYFLEQVTAKLSRKIETSHKFSAPPHTRSLPPLSTSHTMVYIYTKTLHCTSPLPRVHSLPWGSLLVFYILRVYTFCGYSTFCGFIMTYGLPWWLRCKESTCNAGDTCSIPASGRFPEEGNGNPLQYSCLENSMDRAAWWATVVHGVSKGQTWLSD